MEERKARDTTKTKCRKQELTDCWRGAKEARLQKEKETDIKKPEEKRKIEQSN